MGELKKRYFGSGMQPNPDIPEDYMESGYGKSYAVKSFNAFMQGSIKSIDPMMVWKNTREGHEYWMNVHAGLTPVTQEIKDNLTIKFTTYMMGVYNDSTE